MISADGGPQREAVLYWQVAMLVCQQAITPCVSKFNCRRFLRVGAPGWGFRSELKV
jgi:hypothetical protein